MFVGTFLVAINDYKMLSAFGRQKLKMLGILQVKEYFTHEEMPHLPHDFPIPYQTFMW